jgi:diaminopimelate decarboxylase
MSLYTKIVSIKNREHEKIVIVDAGSNLIPGDDYYNYPIIQINKNSRLSEPGKYNIHGCLCDSLDIIGQDVALYNPLLNEIQSIDSVEDMTSQVILLAVPKT